VGLAARVIVSMMTQKPEKTEIGSFFDSFNPEQRPAQ
jgi:hypothetical protein